MSIESTKHEEGDLAIKPDRLGSDVPVISPEKSNPFSLYSSFCPESPEVIKMREAYEGGNPTVLYEFMQGMVDYGRHHTPPPRIYIEYASGERAMFDGGRISIREHDPVIAIEFTNSGPGLSPEDLVIIRHEGNNSKLGIHGRGISVALTLLAEKGIMTEVTSNFKGREWKAESSLANTESGITNVLNVSGRWGGAAESPKTVFRLVNHETKLVAQLSAVKDFFLYANPRFTDAVLVPKESPERTESLAIAVDRGTVMCLEGIVDKQERSERPKDDMGWSYIFVDGLRLPIPWKQKSILPWSIQGLASPKKWMFQVKRSHDSSSIESIRLSVPIVVALRQLTDASLLRTIIQTAMNHPEDRYLELEPLQYVQADFSTATRKIIFEIWKTDYDNALIDDSAERIERYRGCCHDRKILFIPNHDIFDFLKSAGIETLPDVMGLKGSAEMTGLRPLELPSAYAQDNIERLMEAIAKEGGEVTLVILKGKKYLQIKLPWPLKRVAEFDGITENPAGRLIRMAAIMAHVSKIDYHAFSLEDNVYHEIEIKPKASLQDGDVFATSITINTYDRSQYPDFESYEDDATYVLLSGDQINEYGYPTRLEKLIELFLSAIREIRKKLVAIGFRRKKGGKTGNEKKDTEDRRPFKASLIARHNIGQIPIADEIVVRDDPQHDTDKKSENICPVGYYQDGVGTAFSFDADRKSCSWTTSQKWTFVDIPRKKTRRFDSKMVLTDLNGDRPLEVFTGHKIVAFEADTGADVEFFREARTGLYSLRGKAKKIIYYTIEDDDQSYVYNPPLPEERENVVDMDLLLPKWKEFIVETASNPALTTFAKVQLAMRKWSEMFRYAKDDAVGDQISGNSRGEIAAKILNTSCGICNLSASGFALLLRTIDIPSRVCTGYWKQSEDHGGRHMWVEFWNGRRWVPIESEIGIGEDKSEIPQSRHIVFPEKETKRTSRRVQTELEIDDGEDEAAIDSHQTQTSQGNKITIPSETEISVEPETASDQTSAKEVSRKESETATTGVAGTGYKVDQSEESTKVASNETPVHSEQPVIVPAATEQVADQNSASREQLIKTDMSETDIANVRQAMAQRIKDEEKLLRHKTIRNVLLSLLVGALLGWGYASRDKIKGLFINTNKMPCPENCIKK